MSKEKLEDAVEKEISEADPRGEAVRALVNVAARDDKLDTSVEVRTDLNDNSVKIHAVLQVLDKFLGGTVLADLINTKERKLISKDRKSRMEIVEVARNPDTTNIMGGEANPGMLKRFFTSRKPNQ